MNKIALIFSTVDGHTITICERLVEVVKKHGFDAKMIELNAEASINLAEFDRIVLGASIRYGKQRPEVLQFVRDNLDVLKEKRTAYFSVNAVARKPEKRSPESNPYVRKFLASVAWEPSHIGIFGGRICYSKYGFLDRTMIRFIMWITKGPTNLDADVDFTDWSEVEAFGDAISATHESSS